MNRILRVLLAVWAIGYLVISCGPMLLGSSGLATGASLFVGLVLLVPWLVGVLVLVILIWLTNPRRA
jgi:hypothetical protein